MRVNFCWRKHISWRIHQICFYKWANFSSNVWQHSLENNTLTWKTLKKFLDLWYQHKNTLKLVTHKLFPTFHIVTVQTPFLWCRCPWTKQTNVTIIQHLLLRLLLLNILFEMLLLWMVMTSFTKWMASRRCSLQKLLENWTFPESMSI